MLWKIQGMWTSSLLTRSRQEEFLIAQWVISCHHCFGKKLNPDFLQAEYKVFQFISWWRGKERLGNLFQKNTGRSKQSLQISQQI